MRLLILPLILTCGSLVSADPSKEEKPITPAEAAKRANEKVTVEMEVKTSKNALAKRGEIYLDSEENFRDAKNLAVVITRAGAEKFKEAGIADPATHFKGKIIRVSGTVLVKDNRARIEIDDPKRIQVVEKK